MIRVWYDGKEIPLVGGASGGWGVRGQPNSYGAAGFFLVGPDVLLPPLAGRCVRVYDPDFRWSFSACVVQADGRGRFDFDSVGPPTPVTLVARRPAAAPELVIRPAFNRGESCAASSRVKQGAQADRQTALPGDVPPVRPAVQIHAGPFQGHQGVAAPEGDVQAEPKLQAAGVPGRDGVAGTPRGVGDDEVDDCPGRFRCHGLASWCPKCGEVDLVCDDPNCDFHARLAEKIAARTRLRRDYEEKAADARKADRLLADAERDLQRHMTGNPVMAPRTKKPV
jgi:hypothetical protein